MIYPGTCRQLTREEREARAKLRRPALRIRVPDREISFVDRLQGEVRENLARDCGDFILRRSDGVFAYQLAVVVDDALMGVTEVVRGSDLLGSTPRQIFLQQLLGYPTPAYCTEVIYVYLATGLHKTRQHLDEGEFLSVVEMPLEEAVSLAVEGKLPDAKTQIALLKYDALRRRNQLPERGA